MIPTLKLNYLKNKKQSHNNNNNNDIHLILVSVTVITPEGRKDLPVLQNPK